MNARPLAPKPPNLGVKRRRLDAATDASRPKCLRRPLQRSVRDFLAQVSERFERLSIRET